MSDALVDRIAEAVLYEGYILYPYRPSMKNRQRWTFGGLYPHAYVDANPGADNWMMQTQIPVRGTRDSIVQLRVRFLHVIARTVSQPERPLDHLPEDIEAAFRPVASLQVAGKQYSTWQEAGERIVVLDPINIGALLDRPRQREFVFPGGSDLEPLGDENGQIAGLLMREQEPIAGAIELFAEPLAEGLFKLTVRIENRTALENAENATRDEAILRTMVSTHTILAVNGGEFVSLTDPPESCREAAESCENVGTWPVLVGSQGERTTALSSPIILYDYPQIAAESPGELFDSTEIDELLTLRIMTLTEQEKQTMAGIDERASALLQRTENLARAQLADLHGAVRGPETVQPPDGEQP